MFLWLFCCVLGEVANVLKMLTFSVCLAYSGGRVLLFCFVYSFCSSCSCFVFLEGLGSSEVARRATSHHPKLSLFLFSFRKGLGSGELAQRVTSPDPKPSHCFCVCFVLICFFFLFMFCFCLGCVSCLHWTCEQNTVFLAILVCLVWCWFQGCFWVLSMFLLFVVLFASFKTCWNALYVCLSFLLQSRRLDCVLVWMLCLVHLCLLVAGGSSVFFSTNKQTPKNRHGKNPQKQIRTKTPYLHFLQLVQLCSQIVFQHFWGWAWNVWLKPQKNVVSAKRDTRRFCPRSWANIMSKVRSISGPSMLRNIIGPDIDWRIGSI